jgi:flavin reductase (DIM6/NTAB) family NADH-FMN oxidoreductase RutF
MAAAERDPSRPEWFRRVLGQYPTGVSVITGVAADGVPTGLVVGSFTSVSLDPPLIAFFPDKGSSSWPKIRPTGCFCVNVLAHDQQPLCRQFAAKGEEKFAGVSWRSAGSGAPILAGVVAWIDCELQATHDAGDHDIVVGRVLALDVEQEADPLLFFQGGYGRFRPLSLVLGASELRHELHLVDLARGEMESVSRDLGAQCVAWGMVGEELVLLGTAGTPGRAGVSARMVGARVPVVPPVAAMWMAHADEQRREAWLRRAEPGDREGHRRRVEEVRDRGYTVTLRGPGLPEFGEALDGGGLAQADAVLRSLPVDPLGFRPDQADRVAVINVPAFGPDGEVELLLGLHGFPRLRDASELARCVSRLRDAALAVGHAAPA